MSLKIVGRLICSVIVTSALTAFGFSPVVTDDSEFTSKALVIRQSIPLTLHADEVQVLDNPQGGLSLELLREEHGLRVPVAGFDLSKEIAACSTQDTTLLTLELKTHYFSVTNGRGVYQIQNEIPCHGRVQLIFMSDSFAGQALGIWNSGYLAQTKLAQAIGLEFWKESIDFVWPSDSDYYNFGQVHISRGDHWDVVGHELGHAIYDLGDLGLMGGGQHKIDECYSSALALSEGWASYFSAWLRVSANDPDAAFEFLVPRRAPIKFEHIPDDVCSGPNNEWRVIGFFWDLYDQNKDPEDLEKSFAQLWTPLFGSKSSGAAEAMNRLKQSGISPEESDVIWQLNFLK